MTTETLHSKQLHHKFGPVLKSGLLSAKGLYRFSGVVLLLGGAAGTVVHAIHPDGPEGPEMLVQYVQASQPVHLLLFVSIMLILLGFPAVLARQIDKLSLTGLAGYVLLFLGLPLIDLWHSVIEVGMIPALVKQVSDQTLAIVAIVDADPLSATLQTVGAPMVLLRNTPFQSRAPFVKLRTRLRYSLRSASAYSGRYQCSLLIE